MKDLALSFYQKGYGCSQCILKAAEVKYNISFGNRIYDMSGALNSGMGIGGMCSVLISAVMVLGAIFDEETAKKLRIVFLNDFHKKYGGTNCGMLLSKRRGLSRCANLVYDAASILESVIRREREI